MSVVLDASVALPWCFEDEANEASRRLLRHVGDHGAVTTAMWPVEILNAIVTALKRNRINTDVADRYMYLLDRLSIEVEPATAAHSFLQVRPLALRFNLSAYDASYLELAARRDLSLASNDMRLLAAARSAGVPVWDERPSPT